MKTQPLNHALTDSHGREFRAFQYGDLRSLEPEKQQFILVMPGAHCDGERYHWMGEGLEKAGYFVLILDAPEEYRTTPFSPDKAVKTKIIAIEHAIQLLTHLQLEKQPCLAIGHSHGATVILNDLDAAEPKINTYSGCIVLGTHLQAEAFGRKIPGRSDTRPLNKPLNLPIMFIAGEQDAMATPEQVRRTCARYQGDVYCLIQQGSNHLNWAEGQGWADRPDLDGKATLQPDKQRHISLDYIKAFVQSSSPEKDGRGDIEASLSQTLVNGDLFEHSASSKNQDCLSKNTQLTGNS